MVEYNPKDKNMNFEVIKDTDFFEMNTRERDEFYQGVEGVLESVESCEIPVIMQKDNLLIFCKDNENVAGFIHITPEKDREMYVNYIAVKKEYQGRGIASKLYKKAIENLQDMQVDSLYAILFDEYSKKAFCKVGKQKNLAVSEPDFKGQQKMSL